jgi:hypothetical protein
MFTVVSVPGVYIQPEMRQCVCFVYANTRGELKPVGTAFFLGLPVKGVIFTVVVTALHVVANAQAYSTDGKTFLRVNTKDGGFRMVEVEAKEWIRPDLSEEIVDVVFCQWAVLPGASDFDVIRVTTDLAATADVLAAEQIGVGSEAAFAGLFVNHYGRRRNEPIVRFGNISAMPGEPVATEVGDIEAYLVESRSVGGLSGSPVFVDVGVFRVEDNVRNYRHGDGKVVYLLGMMNGHFRAPTKKTVITGDDSSDGTPSSEHPPDEATVVDVRADEARPDIGLADEYVNMGIAVVTPIDKVVKVIQESQLYRVMETATKKFLETMVEPNKLVEGHSITVQFRLDDVDDADQ